MKRFLLLIAAFCILLSVATAQVEKAVIMPVESKEEPKQTAKAEIRVFPNPATLYFRISTTAEIGQVVVINIIGKKVKVYEGREEQRYDIEDLPMGIYLVQIIDDKGKILATRRLSKRMP